VITAESGTLLLAEKNLERDALVNKCSPAAAV